ncbi:hypothetical protein [Variovorax sp. dw_308]|uniref:hypothetical protein n=1 Tax=Variovorax sp. dw_308 TaxID=2721546 RepID=UPI001C474901|nr:hypothetical protein [Variovorax sp. dw_308]
MKKSAFAALVLASILTACGGGSGGSNASSFAGATGAVDKTISVPSAEASSGSTDAKASAREKIVTTHLANEGEIFKLSVPTWVRFGSGSNWREIIMPANIAIMCHVDIFGYPGVAAPRVCETMIDVPDTAPATGKTYTALAKEGEIFRLATPTVVRFGSGNNWREVTMPANIAIMCHVDLFGYPGVGAPRVCETVTDTPAQPATSSQIPGKTIVRVANEGGIFNLAAITPVRFGNGSSWRTVTMPPNIPIMCHVDLFGNPGVPAPRVCESVVDTPAAPPPAPGKLIEPLVREGEIFKLTSPTVVRFGSGNNWREVLMPADIAIMCHIDLFGNPGVPAPRVCETVRDGASSGGAQTLPSIGSSLVGDVVDASGKIVDAAYSAMAALLSKPEGMTYRYGPNAASYGAGGGAQLFGPRPNNNFLGYQYMSPDAPYLWQVGARSASPGLYSSNKANVSFVADSNAAHVGIADFQTTTHMFSTFAQLPQLSWTLYGAGLNSINVADYRAKGIVGGDPVAVTRCGGRPGFCNQGLAAFQNGVIGTVGTNTATNRSTVKLPPNKVPTGIAMTNNSEFALVTVWDTTAMKGQVAVVALAGLCDNCNPFNSQANGDYSAWYNWWNEWMGVYPGLPNIGNIAFMKILGYIDLVGPDGSVMKAPTEIAVTTGVDPFDTMLPGGIFVGTPLPLTNQANRQAFLNGENAWKYAKGGMAVVISKSEKKAAFIDLKPLFAFVNSIYFGGDLGTFNARMASLGQADSQWPYTFANQPQQAPTVVKMISLPEKPTAVKTTVWGPNQRAWIATQEGVLRVYSLGNYAPGRTATATTASSIAELPQFAANVGRNPTSLSWSKGEPDIPTEYADPNMQVIVTSRGDRKISWVRFGANSSSIVRTLQDPRMQDPIAVEDADNFANWGYVVTVADHEGRAVHNFRYGPVSFIDGGACPKATGGCPVIATNGVKIEYGGKMDLPGKPFQVSGANVP